MLVLDQPVGLILRLNDEEVAMAFIQMIELVTHRPDEVQEVLDEWRVDTEGERTAQRGTLTVDRDLADHYVQLVEFPSYEAAMANSDLPATAYFAQQISDLCDSPLTFRNLDVRSVEEL